MDPYLLSALLLQAAERSGLPLISSWAGPISLALSTLALAAVLVGYGRWLEKLNGMGKRVATLETESTAAKTARETLQQELSRAVDGFTVLTRELGRHERSTEACREDTEKLGISLGSEIHKLTQSVAQMDKHLSVEIATVQTILKERGIGQ